MKARFRYRIYPTQAQEQMLAKTFGCCRVVYNDFIDLRRRTDGFITDASMVQNEEM